MVVVHSHKTIKFVQKASKKHDGKYSYENAEYVNNNTKVIITCKIHGDFEQTSKGHLSGKGCTKCGRERTESFTRSNKEDFVTKSNIVHNNKYSYHKVEYVKNSAKIIIICGSHGDFEQTPSNHLRGYGCRKCGIECSALLKRSNTESFIVEANKKHEGRYSYDKVEYINNKTNITITCESHGDFQQTPHRHLSGQGCRRCGGLYPESFNVEANEKHDGKYSHDNVEYVQKLSLLVEFMEIFNKFRVII